MRTSSITASDSIKTAPARRQRFVASEILFYILVQPKCVRALQRRQVSNHRSVRFSLHDLVIIIRNNVLLIQRRTLRLHFSSIDIEQTKKKMKVREHLCDFHMLQKCVAAEHFSQRHQNWDKRCCDFILFAILG